MDEYGGHRHGANLFGTSLVALDVKTGQRKWHFQMVHHDIWDYDNPMAPNLMDVTINGQPRKIIAQTTKQGFVYVLDRVTGEPIWPIPETPVLQTEAPGEETWPTQPIPGKPAPYSQQGLQESDLIDYTPAIKDSALKVAKRCRMGPYFIPGTPNDGSAPSGLKCSWYAPGASGGVNIDGGAAVDLETGMMYVGSQTGLSTIELQKDPCSEFRYSSIHDSCGLLGALPPPPGYSKPAPAGGAAGANAAAGAAFGRRGAFSNIGGISILKPKEFGGVTAYNMNTGEKAWWSPNGVMVPQTSKDPLFAGVNLPPVGGRGQAQIISTKTLVIYGTGRNGQDNPPGLYAVDKATGKQVGMIKIPRTTAVPMTFMHQGKQYIVFATGADTKTALIAVALPGTGSKQETRR
jgi:quinoprotein glucose dehydrogenase